MTRSLFVKRFVLCACAMTAAAVCTSAAGPAPTAAERNASRKTSARTHIGPRAFNAGAVLPSFYRVTDLGTIAGHDTSFGMGVNDAGQVTGYAGSSHSDRRGFLFTDTNADGVVDPGEMVELSTLGGPASSGHAINSFGHVAGFAQTEVVIDPNSWMTNVARATRWQNGVVTNLGTLPQSSSILMAWGIGDSGLVVGQSISNKQLAFVWDPSTSTMTALPGFNGAMASESIAKGIIGGNLIAGRSRATTSTVNSTAALWRNINGQWEAINLGAFMPQDPGEGVWLPTSQAEEINASGQIAGSASGIYPVNELPRNHAFLITPQNGLWYRDDDADGLNDLMLDLGTLGGEWSLGTAINDFGLLVGYSHLTVGLSGQGAFIWADGTMHDLQDLLHPDDAAWALETARDINNSGQIVGRGINPSGEMHAYLLTPTNDDCNFNGVADEDDIANGTSDDCNLNGTPDDCEPDCNDNQTADECDITDLFSDDCNGNGIPDECDPDCNTNNSPDDCDIADETSEDCTGNGTPDECEPDCDGSGTADSCDIADGLAEDCNTNTVPDSCDIETGASLDCNTNGIPDACDVGSLGSAEDCNDNDIPDECDISTGTSDDCNENAVPDECEFIDCNSNGALDSCDIVAGTSADLDENGVPDECNEKGFSLVPIDASGPHAIDGRTITLGEAGQRITFDFLLSGWDLDMNGDPHLRTYEAQLDSTGFTSGTQGALTLPVIDIPCVFDTDCPGFGAGRCEGQICRANGAFFINESRGDYVFFGLDTISAADTSQPDIRLAATLGVVSDSVADDGGDHYTGTLILDVSADAIGTFTIGFLADGTFLADQGNLLVTIPTLNAAVVHLPDCNGNGILDSIEISNGTGVDCNSNGVLDECDVSSGTSQDADGNGTLDECDVMPLVSHFGSRYLQVMFPPGSTGARFLTVTCSGGEGQYVGQPSGVAFRVAPIVEDSIDAAFLAPAEWNDPVHLVGAAIGPNTTYAVRVELENGFLSAPVEVTTPLWGDVIGPEIGDPPDGIADFFDIAAAVARFKNLTGALALQRCDLHPEKPNGVIDFNDIAEFVAAFRGGDYPYAVPPACEP